MSIRTDVTIDWSLSPRIITVSKDGAASEAISLQDLVDTLRYFEHQAYNMGYQYILDSYGKQALGGGVKVGITLVLKNAKLAFEARGGPGFTQCNISGGNLVAVDDVGDDMDPVQTTAYTQVIRTSSSSATLQELLDIQHGAFSGYVTIDAIKGVSGTVYPTGTSRQPVNNLADAKLIAEARGFCCLNIEGGAFTFGATDNIDGYCVYGESPSATTITVMDGCSTINTEFEELELTGALSGSVRAHHVALASITGFQGTAHGCILTGSITLGGTSSDKVHFLECWCGTPEVGVMPQIDMGGDGPTLGIRQYSGGLDFVNKTGSASVSIDLISGVIKIQSSVTAGKFVVRGVGKIVLNEGTAEVLDYGLVVGDEIRFAKDIEGGKWKIDTVAKQMVFYKADNVTEIARFDLFDKDGNPAYQNVFERVRV